MPAIKIVNMPTESLIFNALSPSGPVYELNYVTTLDVSFFVTIIVVPTVTFSFTAVNIVTSTVTVPNHGILNGTVMAVAAGGGTLPTGLTSGNYYIAVIDANTVSFSNSALNLSLGNYIAFTAQGTGTANTISNANFGTGTISLLKSNDGINWDTDSSVSVSASGSYLLSKINFGCRYARLNYSVVSAGIANCNSTLIMKGFP